MVTRTLHKRKGRSVRKSGRRKSVRRVNRMTTRRSARRISRRSARRSARRSTRRVSRRTTRRSTRRVSRRTTRRTARRVSKRTNRKVSKKQMKGGAEGTGENPADPKEPGPEPEPEGLEEEEAEENKSPENIYGKLREIIKILEKTKNFSNEDYKKFNGEKLIRVLNRFIKEKILSKQSSYENKLVNDLYDILEECKNILDQIISLINILDNNNITKESFDKTISKKHPSFQNVDFNFVFILDLYESIFLGLLPIYFEHFINEPLNAGTFKVLEVFENNITRLNELRIPAKLKEITNTITNTILKTVPQKADPGSETEPKKPADPSADPEAEETGQPQTQAKTETEPEQPQPEPEPESPQDPSETGTETEETEPKKPADPSADPETEPEPQTQTQTQTGEGAGTGIEISEIEINVDAEPQTEAEPQAKTETAEEDPEPPKGSEPTVPQKADPEKPQPQAKTEQQQEDPETEPGQQTQTQAETEAEPEAEPEAKKERSLLLCPEISITSPLSDQFRKIYSESKEDGNTRINISKFLNDGGDGEIKKMIQESLPEDIKPDTLEKYKNLFKAFLTGEMFKKIIEGQQEEEEGEE